MLSVYIPQTNEDIDATRVLFIEYIDFLENVLSAYADQPWFEPYYQYLRKEADNLPGDYIAPAGCLLLAEYKGSPAGCVGLTKLDNGLCEMKRLYVKPEFRCRGIAGSLVDVLVENAGKLGYHRVRLATNRLLDAAIKLYGLHGFTEINPYMKLPPEIEEIVVCMELKLA